MDLGHMRATLGKTCNPGMRSSSNTTHQDGESNFRKQTKMIKANESNVYFEVLKLLRSFINSHSPKRHEKWPRNINVARPSSSPLLACPLSYHNHPKSKPNPIYREGSHSESNKPNSLGMYWVI